MLMLGFVFLMLSFLWFARILLVCCWSLRVLLSSVMDFVGPVVYRSLCCTVSVPLLYNYMFISLAFQFN